MSPAQQKNYGFVKRLLVWAGTAALIMSLAAAASLFTLSYNEACDEQDDLLEEVTGVLARLDISSKHPSALWMDDDDFEDWFTLDEDSPQAIAPAGSTVLVRTLHKGGQTIRAVFDKDLYDGAQTLFISGTEYRLYLRTLSGGQHIAVAQRMKEIEKIARQTALAASLPLLALSLALFIILAGVLWYSMKPIHALASKINNRQPDDLTPIDTQGLPTELLPMVDAFNGVLFRIDELRQRESRFVADAAHELRSPLAALSLQAERLEKATMNEQAKKQLADLRISIDRATRLISQLLSLKRAQIQSVKNNEKKAVLSETVAAVIEQIWADAEKKNIEIEVLGFDEYDQEGNVTVDVAEDDLFSILRNLIENAVKYCPEGSTVTIELESLAPFKMNIHDNGPGIPKEERERVFDPFYRVLGSGETGTGLGMAIVKTLAERNGLRITLNDAYPLVENGQKGLMVTLQTKIVCS